MTGSDFYSDSSSILPGGFDSDSGKKQSGIDSKPDSTPESGIDSKPDSVRKSDMILWSATISGYSWLQYSFLNDIYEF